MRREQHILGWQMEDDVFEEFGDVKDGCCGRCDDIACSSCHHVVSDRDCHHCVAATFVDFNGMTLSGTLITRVGLKNFLGACDHDG